MGKIALIHYRLSLTGGLESRIANYANAFSKLGHECHLITARYSPDFQIPNGAVLHILKPGLYPKAFLQWDFGKKVHAHLKKSDYIFSLSMGRTPFANGLVVPGTHLGYLLANPSKFPKLKDYIQIKLDQKSFKSAGVLLAASQKIKSELINLYNVNPKRIHISYPPLQTQQYTPISSEEKVALRTKMGIRPNTRVFLFVSSGHPQKGLNRILKWWKLANAKNAILWIVGSKKTINTPPNVFFAGFQKSPLNYYRIADLLLHPAKYEAFGQVIAEALACECPVAVSVHCGAAEIIPQNAGIALPLQPENTWVELIQNYSPGHFQNKRSLLFQKIKSPEENAIELFNLLSNTSNYF
jgi:glycosyltransferase involved in cell wall biosynthesis